MVISTIRLTADPDFRKEILEVLFSVKGPTEGESGCISCSIYQELQDEHILAYVEVWQNKENLVNHIRSELYRKILTAMDMSSGPPEVQFRSISSTEGMDLIKKSLGYFDIEKHTQKRIGI